MKTKVEITKHPFHLQGVGGWYFSVRHDCIVITSRICMQTYEMIPIKKQKSSVWLFQRFLVFGVFLKRWSFL